ncbi:hypothetical protein Agabi119p4_2401 [Agaricus bisporus var. burnettii]|uniref:CRAL-TRIO domain-containing protein n=1 Tax=Agaricus bisporus var. burnettii TaxID=192524 RepID=A0A8H7F991_AGABI|nr:hypothetical protein Agabi119p4_2401 [Agaricus bisporus var. burnettii]
MDIRNTLQANSERLLLAYYENSDHVLDLQTTLIRDILPSVVDELELGPDATEWAAEWLQDTGSIFRIARRNKFTRSFALESIRKTLVWRVQNLWSMNRDFKLPAMVHCLPEHIRDPFGRPVLVIELDSVHESPEVVKSYILQIFELLRLHLKSISGRGAPEEEPVLQYIVLLDLAKLSLQAVNVDVLTWAVREVVPRFPGMLAGVLVTNYSWAYSGLWSIVRHILPKSAPSRIFFPTQADLLFTMTPAAVPKNYGGALPLLTDLDDPLRPARRTQPCSSTKRVIEGGSSSPTSHQPTSGYIQSISPTSALNPFYGYPISPSRGFPQLHYGRRRKRDLVRTLICLFWLRWRTQIKVGAVLAAVALIVNFSLRRGLLRSPRIFPR